MAEWLKAHAWKACLGETLTWVRIPLSPPLKSISYANFCSQQDTKACAFSRKIISTLALSAGRTVSDREGKNSTVWLGEGHANNQCYSLSGVGESWAQRLSTALLFFAHGTNNGCDGFGNR